MEFMLIVLFLVIVAALIYLFGSVEKELDVSIVVVLAIMLFVFSVTEYVLTYRAGQMDQLEGKSKYVKRYIIQDSVAADSIYVLKIEKE